MIYTYFLSPLAYKAIFVFVLFSCQSEQDKLSKEGYQVFDKQQFAIKCPCVLKKEVYPAKKGKLNKQLEHYQCKAKDKKGKNEVTFMVQFLPQEERTEAELADDHEEFIRYLKKDVESISLSKRNGYEVLSLKYSMFLYSEIYLKPKTTYYITIHGLDASKADTSFFSSVVFLE